MENVSIINGVVTMPVQTFFQIMNDDREKTVQRTIALLKDEKDPEEWVKMEDIAAEYNLHVATLTSRAKERFIERKRVEGGKYAVQRKHINELLKKSSQ